MEDFLDYVHVKYCIDGSFEVYSDDDPDGIKIVFEGPTKDWNLPKKYFEAYKSYLRKKFGPQEDLF